LADRWHLTTTTTKIIPLIRGGYMEIGKI